MPSTNKQSNAVFQQRLTLNQMHQCREYETLLWYFSLAECLDLSLKSRLTWHHIFLGFSSCVVLFLCFCSISLYGPFMCICIMCLSVCRPIVYRYSLLYNCTSLYICMWLPVDVINDEWMNEYTAGYIVFLHVKLAAWLSRSWQEWFRFEFSLFVTFLNFGNVCRSALPFTPSSMRFCVRCLLFSAQ